MGEIMFEKRTELGVVRIEQQPEGIQLWVGGVLVWKSYGPPQATLPSPDHVAVIAPRAEWECWSSLMSDLLCWAAGFNAAIGYEQSDRSPYGVEGVRSARMLILSALSKG